MSPQGPLSLGALSRCRWCGNNPLARLLGPSQTGRDLPLSSLPGRPNEPEGWWWLIGSACGCDAEIIVVTNASNLCHTLFGKLLALSVPMTSLSKM
jgi:hypothetical protein